MFEPPYSEPGRVRRAAHCRSKVPVRTSELVALVAVSSTLFLFLHTRDLSSKLKQMEVRLQPEDALTANQVSVYRWRGLLYVSARLRENLAQPPPRPAPPSTLPLHTSFSEERNRKLDCWAWPR
ncbi:Heparan sulfate 2-O-sulfotransferase pipe [Frankliniella fusca]|uniref:Heparan sulfate 2-O-sulfotransferase pipe n=1 Tax=Frankliniella fusca TaxID=407009 RepID=A0AAE1HIB4_9NEOP|nr:Heparan sulfate 2-O-sulfotransferase pipe [Frankliniella fusca]